MSLKFFTYSCHCSVDTELIDRKNNAKNCINCVFICSEVYRQFSTSFALWEGEGDVVGVKAPLGGVAQVIFHGVQVVEVGVQVRVHQDRGVEEDGEGQVEVEREVEEVKDKRTYTWREDDGLMNDLSLEPRGS